MFSSQIYCVTFVNHRCTGGFTYFTLHFIHATFCIEPRKTKEAIATALQGQPTRQGFLQELSGKGIAAILWQNDSGVIYGVTYIDHNSKTVFKGSLLGKEYSASVINRKYGTIPPEKTEEAPVIHPSEPEMKETELVEGLLDIFSLESYPYPADDLTQSPYGKKKKRKRRGPHLG